MITKLEGQLEIHHERGVVYFHSAEKGWTVFRISRLPVPIPAVEERQLDVTHMVGADWGPITEEEREALGGGGYALEKSVLARLDRVERSAKSAANVASCLANGIKPD